MKTESIDQNIFNDIRQGERDENVLTLVSMVVALFSRCFTLEMRCNTFSFCLIYTTEGGAFQFIHSP